VGCTDQDSNYNNLSFDTSTKQWLATWGFEKSLSAPTKKLIVERMERDGMDKADYDFVKTDARRWKATPRQKVNA
jgi:hypothetical protein